MPTFSFLKYFILSADPVFHIGYGGVSHADGIAP